MVLYPEVQERARREIDTKIAADKLPGWEDRLELPYMRGCMEETLRCMLCAGQTELSI